MEFAGEFETHLTVTLDGAQDVSGLREWAARRGLKCVHILLDGGRTPSQPMLTRRGRGALSAELAAARDVAAALAAGGFAVCRVKIEAAPWNKDVPQTDADAARHPPDRHFEHHVKLLLAPADADLAAVSDVALRHGARLSRNALRDRPDGRRERFVTQRCYGVGRPAARRWLDALLAALRPVLAAGGHDVADVEEEFVVYDTNAGVDAGWLDGRRDASRPAGGPADE